MMRAIFISIFAAACANFAGAQPDYSPPQDMRDAGCTAEDERICILDAIATQIDALPAAKQPRMWQMFMDTVGRAGDADLTQHFVGKTMTQPRPYVPDLYFYEKGKAVLDQVGQDGFVAMARAAEAPFDMGRGDIIGAVAARTGDTGFARRLMGLLGELGTSRGKLGDFERMIAGDALAEAAMRRCDLAAFDKGVALTDAAGGLRYAFLRARITGDKSGLLRRIQRDIAHDDTRDARQALEGYGAILELGMCAEHVIIIAGDRIETDDLPMHAVPIDPTVYAPYEGK